MTTPDQGPHPDEGPDPAQPSEAPGGPPQPRPRAHGPAPTSPAATPEGGTAAGNSATAAASGSGADAPGPPGFFPVPDADHVDPGGVAGTEEDDSGGAAGTGRPWQSDVLALRRRQHELDLGLRRISRAMQDQEQHHHDTLESGAAGEGTVAAEELRGLGERVSSVEDAVRSLSVLLGEQQRAANPPMDWTRMRAAEAREAWPVLAQWVGEILVPCYELTRGELPDCWALHQQVVYELSWLRSTHVQAYLPHAHPDVTAQWYTRWRPAALARVRELIPDSRCRPGEHLTSMEQSRARRSETPSPTSTPPATSADPAAVPPRAQPAAVAHWWGNYCMAAHADVAAREARENARPTDWAPPGLLPPIPGAQYPVPDPHAVGP